MSDFSRCFLVENISRLAAGLLASGHYTHAGKDKEDEGFNNPELIDYDAGKSWKEDGYPRRWPRLVIDEAESLLDDIIKTATNRSEEERLRRHGL